MHNDMFEHLKNDTMLICKEKTNHSHYMYIDFFKDAWKQLEKFVYMQECKIAVPTRKDNLL